MKIKLGTFYFNQGNNQEETIRRIYSPKSNVPNFIKRKHNTRIKNKINSNSIIKGDIDIPPSPTEKNNEQKISRSELNDIIQ